MPGRVAYVRGSSQKICQLTGETDRERNVPAFNRTETRFGMFGTDLGASFEHKGRCYFLFGDTIPSGPNNNFRPKDGDSIAFTNDLSPQGGVNLQFLKAPDGKYLSPSAPGVSLSSFEVPTGGFSTNGRMYIFYTTDYRTSPNGPTMNRSVLLRSDDDGQSFRSLYNVSTDKVINIAPIIVNNVRWPGLPDRSGKGLVLFSSGTQYRHSNVYLSYLSLNRVEDVRALLYFAGIDRRTGMPQWSNREADAIALFNHPVVGELSVTWNPFLQRWLMLYNADNVPGPRGINYRAAETPWGPWSDTDVLFEPWNDGGYGHFIHVSWQFAHLDNVSDNGRQNEWGGEYGPYMIDRYTTGSANRTTIRFVLSTWNPYNTMLMQADLELR